MYTFLSIALTEMKNYWNGFLDLLSSKSIKLRTKGQDKQLFYKPNLKYTGVAPVVKRSIPQTKYRNMFIV